MYFGTDPMDWFADDLSFAASYHSVLIIERVNCIATMSKNSFGYDVMTWDIVWSF